MPSADTNQKSIETPVICTFGKPIDFQETGIHNRSEFYARLQKITDEATNDLDIYYYPNGPVIGHGYDADGMDVQIKNDMMVNETTIRSIYRVIEVHGENNGIRNISCKFLSLSLIKLE